MFSYLALVLCSAVPLFATATRESQPCYRYSFGNISPNETIRATEGSTVNVPFKLDSGKCPDNFDQPVHVHVLQPSGANSTRDFCLAVLHKKGCSSINDKNCPCLRGPFGDVGVKFTKVVTKKDSGHWLWRTSDGLEKWINFEIRERISPDTPESTLMDITTDKHNKETKDLSTHTSTSSMKHGTTSKATSSAALTTSSTEEKTMGMRQSSEGEEEEEEGVSFVDDSVKSGLTFACVNVAIVSTVALLVYICKRRRARNGINRDVTNSTVNAHYSVKVTPVLDANDDVINFRRRHDLSDDARSGSTTTSYVSFGGIVTWSNEDIPRAYDNDGYLATSVSDQNIRASSPLEHL